MRMLYGTILAAAGLSLAEPVPPESALVFRFLLR